MPEEKKFIKKTIKKEEVIPEILESSEKNLEELVFEVRENDDFSIGLSAPKKPKKISRDLIEKILSERKRQSAPKEPEPELEELFPEKTEQKKEETDEPRYEKREEEIRGYDSNQIEYIEFFDEEIVTATDGEARNLIRRRRAGNFRTDGEALAAPGTEKEFLFRTDGEARNISRKDLNTKEEREYIEKEDLKYE